MDQAETSSLAKLAREDFKQKSLDAMKENFLYSMLCFLWHQALSDVGSAEGREKIRKTFSEMWKNNMRQLTQKQLADINKALSEGNIDMLNIITGDSGFADVEDYQEVLTENMQEVDQIFWKLCDEGGNKAKSDE